MLREISIIWGIEDVLWRAKEMDKTITEEQASEVLSLCKSEHDATIGIN